MIRRSDSREQTAHKWQSLTWQEDFETRVNPVLMTGLLHAAVPVLKTVDWKIIEVEEGYCKSILPLSVAATNQHGTHQAAVMALAADYTGGLALASLLRGVPIAGVHHCTQFDSMSLWLAAMNVKFLSPSSGHLEVTCQIENKQAEKIGRRYFAGHRVLSSLEVDFHSNGEQVAVAEMKYFAQPSIDLIPTEENPKVSRIFAHKIKASARLIAAVRSEASSTARIRIDPGHDAAVAGPHGRFLSDRLQQVLPQLKDMVLARTQHGDETLLGIPNLQQVVLLGAGLDMRPFRMAGSLDTAKFFELDLPEMLDERSRLINELPDRREDYRVTLPVDFNKQTPGEALDNHPEFDCEASTAIIYEGCSMYFDESTNERILSSLAPLLRHAESRLWCDFVTEDVVLGQTGVAEIESFLNAMMELGEAFVFGTNAPTTFVDGIGYRATSVISVAKFMGNNDAVFDCYRFVVAGRK